MHLEFNQLEPINFTIHTKYFFYKFSFLSFLSKLQASLENNPELGNHISVTVDVELHPQGIAPSEPSVSKDSLIPIEISGVARLLIKFQ